MNIVTLQHPEFKTALERGHIIPATLPDGTLFIRDSIQFYQAADEGVSMYQGRFMQFSDVLERHDRLKLDENLLRSLLTSGRDSIRAAIARMYSNPDEAVDYLTDLMAQLSRAEQRLDLYADLSDLGVGTQIGRVFEISSVWFFTAQDDPAVYDPVRGEQYCRLWLRFPELYAFFLRLPLARFAPLAALSPETMKKSITALQELGRVDLLDSMRTLLRFKLAGLNNDTTTYLTSLNETLTAYDDSYTYLLTNSTTLPRPTSAEPILLPQNPE